MIFERVPDSEEDKVYHRYVNEEYKIEIGLCPVLYGFRVQVAPVGCSTYCFNYCGGGDQYQVSKLFGMVLHILRGQDVPDYSVFPREKIRPYFNSPEVLAEFERIAKGYTPEPLPPLHLVKNAFLGQTLETLIHKENANRETEIRDRSRDIPKK